MRKQNISNLYHHIIKGTVLDGNIGPLDVAKYLVTIGAMRLSVNDDGSWSYQWLIPYKTRSHEQFRDNVVLALSRRLGDEQN